MNAIRIYKKWYDLQKRCYPVILIFLFFNASCYSQDIFFNKIAAPPGKPFLHITGIVQDNQGYMWFASKNGLFRYDGYRIKQYRNDPLNQNSLSSDALESICIDKDGIIWIGTFNAGLVRFDPVAENFTHFLYCLQRWPLPYY